MSTLNNLYCIVEFSIPTQQNYPHNTNPFIKIKISWPSLVDFFLTFLIPSPILEERVVHAIYSLSSRFNNTRKKKSALLLFKTCYCIGYNIRYSHIHIKFENIISMKGHYHFRWALSDCSWDALWYARSLATRSAESFAAFTVRVLGITNNEFANSAIASCSRDA